MTGRLCLCVRLSVLAVSYHVYPNVNPHGTLQMRPFITSGHTARLGGYGSLCAVVKVRVGRGWRGWVVGRGWGRSGVAAGRLPCRRLYNTTPQPIRKHAFSNSKMPINTGFFRDFSFPRASRPRGFAPFPPPEKIYNPSDTKQTPKLDFSRKI